MASTTDRARSQYCPNTPRSTSVSNDDPNAVDPTRSQNRTDTVLRWPTPGLPPVNGAAQNGQKANPPEGSSLPHAGHAIIPGDYESPRPLSQASTPGPDRTC